MAGKCKHLSEVRDVAPMLEEQLKDRVENVVEWTIGHSFTLFFLALAWLWRHARLSLRLQH